jgi:hypothetical protein
MQAERDITINVKAKTSRLIYSPFFVIFLQRKDDGEGEKFRAPPHPSLRDTLPKYETRVIFSSQI